jgi:hypothetical protein
MLIGTLDKTAVCVINNRDIDSFPLCVEQQILVFGRQSFGI